MDYRRSISAILVCIVSGWSGAVGAGDPNLCDEPGFISAFARVAAARLADFRPDHLLFSFHGLPERQIRKG